ncbi:MAG: hypothetical protein AB8B85_15750 [Paracoccaceae bacterium]
MNDEDKIKPAEIQDEALNEVQGGLRMARTGIRATDHDVIKTVTGLGTKPTSASVIEYQDGTDLMLRKRPGRLKSS